jgi:ribosomal protein L37AE/L43A
MVHEGVWQSIWSLNVPNTVKLFEWRASKNILPTKINLFNRRVVEDNQCPCCGQEEEDELHAIWSCLAAKDVWASGSRIFQKSSFLGSSFLHLFQQACYRYSKKDLNMMAVLARGIWLRRNKWVFEGKFISPGDVAQEAREGLEIFRRCNMKLEVHEEEPNIATGGRWDPPTPPPRIRQNQLGCIDQQAIGMLWNGYHFP